MNEDKKNGAHGMTRPTCPKCGANLRVSANVRAGLVEACCPNAWGCAAEGIGEGENEAQAVADFLEQTKNKSNQSYEKGR